MSFPVGGCVRWLAQTRAAAGVVSPPPTAGRMLDERTVAVGSDELIGWASALDTKRLWAVEDCRLLTPWLERQLLGLGEELVRVSPKLTVPERRAGRVRGKSDPIDALAVAGRRCGAGSAAAAAG